MRIMIFAIACVSVQAFGGGFECSFAKGGWNPDNWILVKSPRWDHFGGWVQKPECIENETPPNATPKELLAKFSHDTYSSMVTKREFKGAVAISAEMAFTDRMAPLIVIAPELGKSAKGIPEYREHFEIVIFDKGVNVWHHYYKNGKPYWKKTAFSKFPLQPNEKYVLKVQIKPSKKGKMITLSIDGHEFGYIDDSLPDSFHVGVTGCEGLNRFYNFKVTELKP